MEWHGPKTDSSPVYIQLQADKVLKVLDGRGSVLRVISLKAHQRVEVILSSNKGNKALLLKSPKEYDLVSTMMAGVRYLPLDPPPSSATGCVHHAPLSPGHWEQCRALKGGCGLLRTTRSSSYRGATAVVKSSSIHIPTEPLLLTALRWGLLQVLLFNQEAERSNFIGKLRGYLEQSGLDLHMSEMKEQSLMKRAVTQEQRKQILETFFRHLFAQVCRGVAGSDAWRKVFLY